MSIQPDDDYREITNLIGKSNGGDRTPFWTLYRLCIYNIVNTSNGISVLTLDDYLAWADTAGRGWCRRDSLGELQIS